MTISEQGAVHLSPRFYGRLLDDRTSARDPSMVPPILHFIGPTAPSVIGQLTNICSQAYAAGDDIAGICRRMHDMAVQLGQRALIKVMTVNADGFQSYRGGEIFLALVLIELAYC